MKSLSNIKFIGDILVYDEPFLSLYYDYKEKAYALFLKANNMEKKNIYLFFYVNKENIMEFLNESAGLWDIASNKKIYTTEKRLNGSFMKVSEVKSHENITELKSNDMFDSDYCIDYCEIIWQLNN